MRNFDSTLRSQFSLNEQIYHESKGWNFPGWREQCEVAPMLRHPPDGAWTGVV
jgi:hypothetical protein